MRRLFEVVILWVCTRHTAGFAGARAHHRFVSESGRQLDDSRDREGSKVFREGRPLARVCPGYLSIGRARQLSRRRLSLTCPLSRA